MSMILVFIGVGVVLMVIAALVSRRGGISLKKVVTSSLPDQIIVEPDYHNSSHHHYASHSSAGLSSSGVLTQAPPDTKVISSQWVEDILRANNVLSANTNTISSMQVSNLTGGCHYSVSKLQIQYNNNVNSLKSEGGGVTHNFNDNNTESGSAADINNLYDSLPVLNSAESYVSVNSEESSHHASQEVDIESGLPIQQGASLPHIELENTGSGSLTQETSTLDNKNEVGAQSQSQSCPNTLVVKFLLWNKTYTEKLHLYSLVKAGGYSKDLNNNQDAQHLLSYSIESQFYTNFSNLVRGISLPKVYYNYEDLFNNKFGMVLQDLSGLEDGQPSGFDFHNSFTCLKRLASFHAVFWHHEDLFRMNVWDQAGHWTGKAKAIEKRTVDIAWDQVKQNFEGYFIHKSQSDLGRRMSQNLTRILDAFKSFPIRTLLHGDYKVTNLFLDNSNLRHSKVYVIDWQWAGRGTGALDVAYFLCTSADVSSLTTQKIKHLVKKAYHVYLLKKITKYAMRKKAKCGASSEELLAYQNTVVDYQFSMFWYEFMICVIDFVVYCITNKWCKMTPATVEEFAAKNHDGLHLRSFIHMQMLVDLAESFMNKLGMF